MKIILCNLDFECSISLGHFIYSKACYSVPVHFIKLKSHFRHFKCQFWLLKCQIIGVLNSSLFAFQMPFLGLLFGFRMVKSSIFEYIRYSNVRNLSPHCINNWYQPLVSYLAIRLSFNRENCSSHYRIRTGIQCLAFMKLSPGLNFFYVSVLSPVSWNAWPN